MKELDIASLTQDLPEHGLKRGDLGAIVFVYNEGEAYEVEFATLDGETVAVLTLSPDQVRPTTNREIAHTRTIIG